MDGRDTPRGDGWMLPDMKVEDEWKKRERGMAVRTRHYMKNRAAVYSEVLGVLWMAGGVRGGGL